MTTHPFAAHPTTPESTTSHPMDISPKPVAFAQPYLDGLTQGQIRFQQCTACGQAQIFAHDACTHCASDQLVWKTSTGHGCVFAVTIVSRAPSDAFRALAPYTLVVVEMQEGARVMGHAQAGIKIGDQVIAEYFEHAGHTLIRFELINSYWNKHV